METGEVSTLMVMALSFCLKNSRGFPDRWAMMAFASWKHKINTECWIFFLLNVLRPFLETLSFIILQTDLYLRFLLVQIEVLDARLCYLRIRIQWFICNTKQRETRSPVNKSVRCPETADKWAARSHQQGATQTVFVSTDTFYYLQSCTQRKVFRFYCATQTRIKMFGGQEPSGSWLGDILKSNTRLITRFKNWTRCHTN